VSCGSAGNCAAGGDYSGRHTEAFVADERDGVWGTAIEVPGMGALNTAGDAGVTSVSCGSAGNCAAGGTYWSEHPFGYHGFVAVERHGVWGTAIEVPGLAALNTGAGAEVLSVSCASAGNCAAGGDYTGRQGGSHGFVADERNGRWGRAIQVPGPAAPGKGLNSQVNSVSCASAGNCAAGGYYSDQGFVAVERNGVWRTAIAVPGLAALNTGGDAQVSSVSCASAASCAAGGYYTGRHRRQQGFLAVERNGRWGTATGVPGLAALNTGAAAEVRSVSCGSAGNCAAGGYYASGIIPPWRNYHGFVAVERNGRWGTATEMPGPAGLNSGEDATVMSVSCGSAGSCAADGLYGNRYQRFVASEDHGVWDPAIEVPGLAALNKGTGARYRDGISMSCAPAGPCAVGGNYFDASGNMQGFVTQGG